MKPGYIVRIDFNSRPSARGDKYEMDKMAAVAISIHAPPRGATFRAANPAPGATFQFTPLREGRLHERRQTARKCVFQFTPLREGRQYYVSKSRKDVDFNSRPSARGDGSRCPFCWGQQISIHAPPRGATAKDMQFLQIFCSTLTNQHGLTIVPRNLSRLFW